MCVNNVIQSRGALGGLLSGCYWALSLHTDTRGDIAAHHRSRQGLRSQMSSRTGAKMASLDALLE